MILNFSKSGDVNEAFFVSKNKNVLQIHFAKVPISYLRIETRVNSDMPWHQHKLLANPSQNYIADPDIPAGLEVKITTDVDIDDAGLSQS